MLDYKIWQRKGKLYNANLELVTALNHLYNDRLPALPFAGGSVKYICTNPKALLCWSYLCSLALFWRSAPHNRMKNNGKGEITKTLEKAAEACSKMDFAHT